MKNDKSSNKNQGMTATISFIEETFNHFNTLCFEGVLPSIPIILTRARSFLGKVEYRNESNLFGSKASKKDFRMKISTSFNLEREKLEDVVLHEMIHYYIAWRNIKDNSTHGNIFRIIMEQLNTKYGRHITIRHKVKDGEVQTGSLKLKKHYVCVTTFRDETRYVTVAASTRILELHRCFSRCTNIVQIQWYGSLDPFFNRYPHSKMPKLFAIAQDELEQHLENSVVFNCNGHNLLPVR